jgi:hypothetical protein
MDGYDDDERPSWREIDKRRDGSSHTSGDRREKEKKKPEADRWNTGRRKKALEKLFMGDKGTIEHEKLYKKIHTSYGAPRFVDNVRKYVEKYGPRTTYRPCCWCSTPRTSPSCFSPWIS